METPSQLSHAIQEVCHRFLIVCLSLEGTVPDSTGVLCLRGRGGHVVPTLSVDLGDVGVGSGFVHEISIRGQMGVCGDPCASSEIAHQGICHDVACPCQIIPHDQAQGLCTLSGLVEHPNVPISSVGAVGMNDGDGKGGRFGLGHVVCLNFSHYRHGVSSTATSLVPLAQPTTRGRPVCIINPPEVRGSIVQLLQLVVLHYTYQGLNP